jgi:5'-deoxynucleotidase
MKMPQLTAAEMLRVGHVVRWSIVRTSRPQTVAEHTTLVMLLSLMIADKLDASVVRGELLLHALFHDIAEVRLGDMPTPTKAALKARFGFDPIKLMEDEIAPPCTSDRLVRAIVKLADIIEAFQFLDVEGVGSHAFQVKEKMRGLYSQKIVECERDWPNLDWHLIDELLNIHKEDRE